MKKITEHQYAMIGRAILALEEARRSVVSHDPADMTSTSVADVDPAVLSKIDSVIGRLGRVQQAHRRERIATTLTGRKDKDEDAA